MTVIITQMRAPFRFIARWHNGIKRSNDLAALIKEVCVEWEPDEIVFEGF